MTTKATALIAGWTAGISSFVAWLVSLPPENQDALIKPMIELTPLTWRPVLGFATRLLATVSLIYATHQSWSRTPVPPSDAHAVKADPITVMTVKSPLLNK